MRKGNSFTVAAAERKRLEKIVSNPRSQQKHFWRCRIVLLGDAGHGAHAIMAATSMSKTIHLES